MMAWQNLEAFCMAIQEIYMPNYLLAPNEDDLRKILREEFCQGVPWMYWQSLLHVLGMEKLPNCFNLKAKTHSGMFECQELHWLISSLSVVTWWYLLGGRISAGKQCVQNAILSCWWHLLPLGNINPIKFTCQTNRLCHSDLYHTERISAKDIERTFALIQGKFHILASHALVPKQFSRNYEDVNHITQYYGWIKSQTNWLTSPFAIY